jgi:hypothetical protein
LAALTPLRWSSLDEQRGLAATLFGARGEALIDDWLDEQVARVDDADFAEGFAAHVGLPGIASRDFNHRDVRTPRGRLLGGIRFYGRDVTRPFVEVCGHDFAHLDDLRACVRAEWSEFAPKYLRVQALPGRVTGSGVVLDTTLHAARYRDMPAADGRVTLVPFDRVADAVTLVEQRYSDLAADDPDLRRNVSPADTGDLERLHSVGALCAVHADGERVGVLAIAPGAIGWLPGDEIHEEVVVTERLGHGYAASAQLAWATAAVDPGRLLIGTIDRLNAASRRTALRAGRPALLEAFFVSL